METQVTARKRFYFKHSLNEREAVEVYMGQNSGKQLSMDLKNAQSEVLIISPFIDESKIDDLFYLKNRGVNVKLAFSTLRTDQERSILRKLIQQNRSTDLKKKQESEKKGKIFQISSIAAIVLGVLSFTYTLFRFVYAREPDFTSLLVGIACIILFKVFQDKKRMALSSC